MLSIGIIGLPNVGKSTLFQAITKIQVEIKNFPFTTIKPNVGVVAVPDLRLEELARILKPKKVTPAVIEFMDIAGLVEEAHQGKGLGNQFLNEIQRVDALIHVVRSFENPGIIHVEGRPDPQRDINIIHSELCLRDLAVIENQNKDIESGIRAKNKEALRMAAMLPIIKNLLETGLPLSLHHDLVPEIRACAKILGLITIKPMLYLFNVNTKNEEEYCLALPSIPPANTLCLNLNEELAYAGLSLKERQELGVNPRLDDLIVRCYNILDLISFFTVKGGEELRAWPIARGTSVFQAAGKIHTDFQEKFIKAAVVSYVELSSCGSWTKAQENGLIRTEGKEYIVQDGDVLEMKI